MKTGGVYQPKLIRAPLPLGTVLNQYRIEGLLGQGGSGTVFRATDLRLHRQVALKVLRPDPQANERFWKRLLREARAISRLNHPCFCTIYEVAEDQGVSYIAMEYVEGPRLRDLISGRNLIKGQILVYGAQIASALAHAHEHRVIHGDVKSTNIIIEPHGVAKLLDFGLALRTQEEPMKKKDTSSTLLEDSGKKGGTLAYSAPEILRGQRPNVQSDIWALGALLYEMCSGKLPFTGQTVFEISLGIMAQAPPPLPADTDSRLSHVIQRCLQKDCARRYAAAQEVRDDLERVQLGPRRRLIKALVHFRAAGGYN